MVNPIKLMSIENPEIQEEESKKQDLLKLEKKLFLLV
jgi:hypothetical protein